MKKHAIKVFAILMFFTTLFLPTKVYALVPFSGSGTWGAFEGTLEYTATDATTAMLQVYLKNTSSGPNGGFLTGFALNNVNDAFSNITLDMAPTNFNLLGAPTFMNGVDADPYGAFDFGAGLGDNFLGGGNTPDGIAVDNSGIFKFTITGTNLQQITEVLFFDELSLPKNPNNVNGNKSEALLVRFRGFENEQSDKVPGVPGTPPPVVPEPATMILFGTGMVGAFVRRRQQA